MSYLYKTNAQYLVSTDPSMLDLPLIHQFLSTKATWSKGIPFEKVQKSIEHSLCFGIYLDKAQIGFARVISDYASIAYLGDVFVLEEFRGRGLSKWLLQEIHQHPLLQGLRRWILLTADAHELYAKYGWKTIAAPEKWMEIHHPSIYL